MNNAAKAEAPKEKAPDNRKPQNSEALRSQEQKVTHDKVSCLQLHMQLIAQRISDIYNSYSIRLLNNSCIVHRLILSGTIINCYSIIYYNLELIEFLNPLIGSKT